MWDLYFPFPSSLTTSPFLSSGDFTLKACLHSVCAVFGLCHSEFSLDYHALSPGSCDSLLTSSLVSNYVFFFFFFLAVSSVWNVLPPLSHNVGLLFFQIFLGLSHHAERFSSSVLRGPSFLPFHAGLRDSLSNPYFFSSLHLPSWPFLVYLVDYWLSFRGEYNVHEVRDLISSVKPIEPQLRVQNMIDT